MRNARHNVKVVELPVHPDIPNSSPLSERFDQSKLQGPLARNYCKHCSSLVINASYIVKENPLAVYRGDSGLWFRHVDFMPG